MGFGVGFLFGGAGVVVFFWFVVRGRDFTIEFMVMWYLFWDALTRYRCDGTLVLLSTALAPVDYLAAADRRLTDFAQLSVPELRPFIPD